MTNAWKSRATAAAVLILLTIVTYVPALRNGFVWDDDAYVTNNQALRSLAGLDSIWFKPRATSQYYPLAFTSFWAEYHLWKLQPLGYHLINILLHALNAVLLWALLRRLEVPGAWWAAAVFAVHPVMVESVAWIMEQKSVLSCTFYLLAALAYLRFRPLADKAGARGCDWRFYPLVLVLFLCALLSKTVTCSLPAVLVLLIWWKRGRVEKHDVLALIPLFVLGATLGLTTAWLEKHHVGATGADWSLSFGQRCLLAGRVLWFYAGKLVWPRNLTFIYPRWEIDPGAAWQYLFPLAALAVLTVLWLLRARIGRGPLMAVLFFAGTLVPALGFFDVYPFRYSFVADHFQYIASIGLITLVAGVGTAISRRAGRWGHRLGTLAAVAVIPVLATSSWTQTHAYKNLETLWRDTLAKNPNAWLAHNNLATVLGQSGRLEEAVEQLNEAVRIKPDYAEAHYNLAKAMMELDKPKEAVAQYEESLRLDPNDPEAHYNLGNALLALGKTQAAVDQWEQAVELNPNHAEARNNLGAAFAQAGRLPEAIDQFTEVVRIIPNDAEAHYNLGNALLASGETQSAIEQFERACDLGGDRIVAYLDTLAAAYARAGRLSDAATTAQKAINLARAAGQTDVVKEIERRLELYRHGHAYRR